MKPVKLIFIIVLFMSQPAYSQVNRVEPLNWWVGMHDPHLQLMIHGKNISKFRAEIDYPGVILESAQKTENPNYLFLNLEISGKAKPGTFFIEFTSEAEPGFKYAYDLLKRDPASTGRRGFDNSDVICLLMPDRFANGDPSNDIVQGMRESKIDRTDKTGRHGGDLKGISEHLDYFKEMGFTAIWLNPFLENDVVRSSYHGYSTTDFYRTEPRYGPNEDFKNLLDLANDKGIKIIMDMIFNHIGIDHWWMNDLPSSDWINFNDHYVQSNHRRTVNQDLYASEYDRKLMVEGWFVRSMPDLNQRNPFLANYLVQNSIWWIEYAGLSGIRMDTYPYPDKIMMAEWNKRVLAEYPDFNVVGEEWSLNPGIVSYWQKGQCNRDGYDGNIPSMMDFPLQSAVARSLNEAEGWINLYEMIANDYLYPNPYNLVIFPDNHDMSRFFMQVGMNRDLYKLGIIYFLTTRGIPQIFYGSEILMTHIEGDHHGWIRKDFPGGWAGDRVNGFTGVGLTEEQIEMQQFFRKLLNWRKENPVIHTGKMIHYAPENGVYVYGRYNDEKTVMVLLNKSNKNQSLNTERFYEIIGQYTEGKDLLSEKSYKLDEKINVPALTGLIIELK